MNLPSTKSQALSLGLDRYFTGKPCKNGHVSERRSSDNHCMSCVADRYAKYKAAGTCAANSKRYHKENREDVLAKMRERNKRYYEKNKERLKAASSTYQKQNSEKRTEYKKLWAKEKASSDPSFKMGLVCRRMLHRVLGVSGQKKSKRTAEMLGYTGELLAHHLEKQFQKGMSWENYGQWHIDHITPIAAFASAGSIDPAKVNCLTNLRPMWASDNMSKGAKVEALL